MAGKDPLHGEKIGTLCRAHHCAIAAPLKISQHSVFQIKGMCAHRIKMNIIGHRSEIFALINRQSPVAPLEQMPPNTMTRIEPLRIGTLKPLHPIDQVRLRGLQQKVVMIAHQHKRVNQPPIALGNLSERIQKPLAVFCILKDRLLMIPAAHHVIGRTFKLSSGFSCHAGHLSKGKGARQ